MDLVAFSLEGYKRFVQKTSVKLQGKLIAIVGPNEAGKSSLLGAMAHLHNRDSFEVRERPRRSSHLPEATWHFLLDQEDKSKLASVHDTAHIERLVISKRTDGSPVWHFMPRNPSRDISRRKVCAKLLGKFEEMRFFRETHTTIGDGSDLSVYDFTLEILQSNRETLTVQEIDHLQNVLGVIRQVSKSRQDDALQAAESIDQVDDHAAELVQVLTQQIRIEQEPEPWQLACDALESSIPRVIIFAASDRELASEYDLEQVAANPPPALKHLAKMADLDLGALYTESSSRAVADVGTRRNAANQRLLEIFSQSWNQQGIAIQFEVQGNILHVQVTTPEDSGLSDIQDRSDGIRWFAALLAFTYGVTNKPILLVDEIETHLHYDAQADLISVLARQKFASKVIYTTHSFGCLPYDLGTGVRVVQPLDAATSKLENGFWRGGAGFSPLLASMGAAAMSFTPTRRAVIAEGAADAILLPVLLRQSSKKDYLGFQVAPGLSSVASSGVGELNLEAARVGFVVDGDNGGKAIAKMLQDAGVDKSLIALLQDISSEPTTGLEVEDFINPKIYATAINEELRCWNEIGEQITEAELGDALRTKLLKQWCDLHSYSVPDKVAVAQRIADMSADHLVYQEDRAGILQELLARLNSIVQVSSD
ncbi:AAA family ATPase [Amycolatopsis sp. lyj-109]|uniref:AAA family ATPase n=1 Tax=Amycolatopsis sp. lyj-109 TaxID=2789287 RepID=UPI00397E40D8